MKLGDVDEGAGTFLRDEPKHDDAREALLLVGHGTEDRICVRGERSGDAAELRVARLAERVSFAIAELIAGLMQAGYFIQPGYGKTAATHWRIGHMGDHTPKCVQELLDVTDGVLKRIAAKVAARG